jgi:hypothetical protein
VTDSVLQRGDSPISGKRYLTAEPKNVMSALGRQPPVANGLDDRCVA